MKGEHERIHTHIENSILKADKTGVKVAGLEALNKHVNVDDKDDVEMAPASGGAPSFHVLVSDSLAPASASGGELAAGGVYEEHAGMETDDEEDVRAAACCARDSVTGEFSVGVEDFVNNEVAFGTFSAPSDFSDVVDGQSDSGAVPARSAGGVRIEGDGWMRDAAVATRASARHLAGIVTGLDHAPPSPDYSPGTSEDEAEASASFGTDNFTNSADPITCNGRVCIYPAIKTLSPDTLQQVLQVLTAAGEPCSASDGATPSPDDT
ncbi:hypothetical protein CYMTET_26417 [Cymbomonas tetramitiformis]|uniref:Uncharacterized protein n=1 Tax=Cymbomonas tetramitiformis TaxID=36881 RepID=A0AAE0FSC4_9CHLO|nr:hypothetical protein CYMTET_26417 [Cymbomonas tetramitiformis]